MVMPVLNVDGLGIEELVNPARCGGCGCQAEFWLYEVTDPDDPGFYLCWDCLEDDQREAVNRYRNE